jgi:type I restriction enzyme, S subunit
MAEWNEYKLGEIIEHKKGFAFKSNLFGPDGEIVVRVSDTTASSIDVKSCHRIKSEFAKELSAYRIKTNDIIIATVGSWAENPNSIVGKVIRVPEEANNALLNQNSVRLRAKTKESQTFLYYRLRCKDFSDFLISGAQGSANQASISLSDIFEFSFPFPSLPEQQAIAEVLSSLDEKIDLLHRQNKTLEALADTLFRQWFVEEAEESWNSGKLGDVISVKGGTTPSTSNPEFWDGDIYWTSPRDLSNHTEVFLTNTERKITEKGLSKIGSGLLPIGTVLLSSRAPIGYLAITEIPVAINQGYIAIVCDKLISNHFIYLWVKKNLETIIGSANGSVFLEISKSTFRDLSFQVPPQTKLESFNEQAKPIFQKIKSNVYQIHSLTTLRDALLPKLMSGEVRVEK